MSPRQLVQFNALIDMADCFDGMYYHGSSEERCAFKDVHLNTSHSFGVDDQDFPIDAILAQLANA